VYKASLHPGFTEIRERIEALIESKTKGEVAQVKEENRRNLRARA
jgi:hypothetical protein